MTIKQIAKKANVSIATVDRVLHKRGIVSKETRDKILHIIKQSGYKTNIFASHLKLAKTFNFATIMPEINQESKFWESTGKGIIRALNELSIYKIKNDFFFFDRFSDESFIKAGNELLNKKYDGIIIVPVMDKLVYEFIKKIPENTPYVFFNTNIPDTNPITFIGQDSFMSGLVAANLMKKTISGKGDIAIIQASEDEYHHAQRVKGFLSFFENDDSLKMKIYRLHGNTEKDSFLFLMKKILEENESLRGIFVTSANCHYAAEYLKNMNHKEKIHIIGYDLVEKNITYLMEDLISFLISQKPEDQGYQALYSLYKKLVLHEMPQKSIMMPIDIIIKENLMYYLSK
jgi:LacI family transcriptional regulator